MPGQGDGDAKSDFHGVTGSEHCPLRRSKNKKASCIAVRGLNSVPRETEEGEPGRSVFFDDLGRFDAVENKDGGCAENDQENQHESTSLVTM